jgi:p-cumate 2,3-dioxygenase ferredoxin subunit
MPLVDVCAADAVAPGSIVQGTLPDGRNVAIYNVAGAIYVTDDLCTHGQSSLAEEGMLDGFLVECGWHYGRFDVRTGAPAGAPCAVPLASYAVTIRDGRVLVEVG